MSHGGLELVQILQQVPLIGLVVSKAQETLGEKASKFLINGSAAIIVVAIIGWAFSVERRLSDQSTRLEQIEQIKSQLQENQDAAQEALTRLQAIQSHLTNEYGPNTTDATK